MPAKQEFPGQQPFDNKQGIQPVETEVDQSVVAREAHGIIEMATGSLMRNPKFLTALGENYFEGNKGYVTYEDGDALHSVMFDNKIIEFHKDDIEERSKNFEYKVSNKRPDGTYSYSDKSIRVRCVYMGDEPTAGRIWSRSIYDKVNTPSIIREVRGIVAENFPQPQSQPQTQPLK